MTEAGTAVSFPLGLVQSSISTQKKNCISFKVLYGVALLHHSLTFIQNACSKKKSC